MDNVIREAFTKHANPGSLYYVWVFDPQSGEVDLYDSEQHSLEVPSHQDLAQQYPHESRLHGYAYRIINGWRVTDWDDKPLDDPYVLRTVQDALREAQGRTGHVLRIAAARAVQEKPEKWNFKDRPKATRG